ncbi:hypothetical protein AB0J90_28360 [Micromonospora sp. NPDC049523]|uniref:hypothetical protein n=1 Tax=Micromonospora sp. NPDC049523 TaxID=3155921 RepID=UPI00342E5798
MTEPARSRLVKVTFNLTPSANSALDRLVELDGNRTDALNHAVKIAALLHDLAPEGHFTIVRDDGVPREIYLI